jgi:hypothetical protein
MTQFVESKFFPSPTGAITAPGAIWALTEVVDEQTLCQSLCRNANDRCFAAALSSGTGLWVQYFCIPISPGASVYASETGNLWDLGVSASDVSQIGFINGNGAAAKLQRPQGIAYDAPRGRLLVAVAEPLLLDEAAAADEVAEGAAMRRAAAAAAACFGCCCGLEACATAGQAWSSMRRWVRCIIRWREEMEN